MDLCNELYSAGQLTGRPASLRGKTFNIQHYMQTVQPNAFIPAMLIGTIDLKNVVLLSLTLTLLEGYKVNAKQNLLASFSPTFFISPG